ncbi:O-fucosyltransferase 23-like [Salvia hispanica]|uniref:O-fucosyltransferase 23-like n=1 Tax=Salvia hispanica TaxID=49212 RepID=UPI002008F5E7|nr:O-fucosyltransferase 23-like [Salvia hispanica]XP_047973747.1 O-fucosyltransferase 23-like [Salvia hispanica]
MELLCFKSLKLLGLHMNSLPYKCAAFLVVALMIKTIWLPSSSNFRGMRLNPNFDNEKSKFLEVPQIVWGLNNQKIAFARACLTARMLNRTLLMPSLSASLFYKEVDQLRPISFDKVFQFEEFNARCQGFVRLGRYSEVLDTRDVFELQKGSGRRWTVEKDLEQLREFGKAPYDEYQVIRVVGKNPFLWHDHWPAKDYAKIFECLDLVEEISREADKVVSKIREIGKEERSRDSRLQVNVNATLQSTPYVAVHMRIEKDWMIHCKKLEQRLNVSEICSSKEQIMRRVGSIVGLETPIVVYLAVADNLLEDNSILEGWGEGLLPYEKKKLGVLDVYKKHPYLIQSAIDYEVCLRSDVFVGNTFSTFSSLVVLERTQWMMSAGVAQRCGLDVRWPSYAYNLEDESNGPRPWAANMSDVSLQAISYGSNRVSCW